LTALQEGDVSVEDVLSRVVTTATTGRSSRPSATSVAAVDGVQLDLGRSRRCGFPEVVYSPGKTEQTMVEIFRRLQEAGQDCLATRASAAQLQAIHDVFPQAVLNERARTARISSAGPVTGRVPVLTAGTSDLPIAEEALETLRWMHCGCDLVTDVGVAGPQRLLQQLPQLEGADAVVVVAGMEGALPSVVGGWVDCPVIAVPTSVGYGASLGGLAALLGMLNSCAANVCVVNIDAGFKGGYLAGMMALSRHREEA
jgi:hypothetical protein